MQVRYLFAFFALIASSAAIHAEDDVYGDPLPAGAKSRLGTIRYRFGFNYPPVVAPDAKTIYATDGWNIARYDVMGAPLAAVPAGTPNEPPVVFSADGKRAVANSRSTIVWDLSTGKTIANVKRAAHFFDRGQQLTDISADGKVLAIGGSKRDAKDPADVLIWDVDRDKEIAKIVPPQNELALVAISPDGKAIAVWGKYTDPSGKFDPIGNPGQYVNFFDATNGKELSKLRVVGFAPADVAFSPDGSLAAVASTSAIELVDPKSGKVKELLLARSGHGKSLEFSRDGTTLFAATTAGAVQSWRVKDGIRLSTTEPPIAELYNCAVRVISAERAIAWATKSAALVVWEVPSGKLLSPTTGHFSSVLRVAVTPDSRHALTSAYDGQALKWELATGKLVGKAPGHPWPGRFNAGSAFAEFSPNGSHVLASDFGGFGVHDGETGRQQFVIPGAAYGSQRAFFSADGSKIITTQFSYDGKKEPAAVTIWDSTTAKRLFTMSMPGNATIEAALTPDGKHLVIASRKTAEKGLGEFIISAWEIATGKMISESKEDASHGTGGVATASDNKSAVVVTSKSKVVRFDIESGKTTSISPGIDYVSAAPVFSADGKLVALYSASSFGRMAPVAVVEWESGKAKYKFDCTDGGPTCAAFSPDGKYLVTGTHQSTAIVWDLTK
jgi:WD40 repeat protein